MGWFSRRSTASDVARAHAPLVTSDDLANFARVTFLHGASGVTLGPYQGPLDLVRPMFECLYGDDSDRQRVLRDLHHHARSNDVWTAFGAWRFCVEFLDQHTGEWRDIETAGVNALIRMEVQNLGMTLSMNDADAYERVTGERPPGGVRFFGPPLFDNDLGPNASDYAAAAAHAASARRPVRVLEARGVPVGPASRPVGRLHDFAQLLFQGPFIYAGHREREGDLVADLVEAAYGVDHEQFAQKIVDDVRALDDSFWGWTSLGAARFIEDYLDTRLTGGASHLDLLGIAAPWLRAPDAWGVRLTAVAVMTPTERSALDLN